MIGRRSSSKHKEFIFIAVVLFLVTSFSCQAQKTKTGKTRSKTELVQRGSYKFENLAESNSGRCRAPKLKILSGAPLKVGQELMVECVFQKCTPSTQNDWYLDEELLPDVLSFDDIDKTVSVLTREVTKSLDAKTVSCKVSSSESPAEYQEANLTLSVLYKPLDLPPMVISNLNSGDSVDIGVVFQSNPKPSSLIWIAGDKKIYYGTKGGKFVSKEMSAVDRNYWNASLKIMNLTREDLASSYTLLVRNTEGDAEYQIRLEEGGGMEKVTETYAVLEEEEVVESTEMTTIRSSTEPSTEVAEEFTEASTKEAKRTPTKYIYGAFRSATENYRAELDKPTVATENPLRIIRKSIIARGRSPFTTTEPTASSEASEEFVEDSDEDDSIEFEELPTTTKKFKPTKPSGFSRDKPESFSVKAEKPHLQSSMNTVESTRTFPYYTRKPFSTRSYHRYEYKAKSTAQFVERAIKRKNETRLQMSVVTTTHETMLENPTSGSDKATLAKTKIFKRPTGLISLNATGSTSFETSEVEHVSINPPTSTELPTVIANTTMKAPAGNLNSFQSTAVEFLTKAIIWWRTSLVVIINVLLLTIIILCYRKIKSLKAKIVEQNLGASSNNSSTSSSYLRTSNAYTPTCLPYTKTSSKGEYDYQLSAKSRSICYAGALDASHHSYESIGENIYAEITSETDLHSNCDEHIWPIEDFDRCVETRTFSNEMVSTYI